MTALNFMAIHSVVVRKFHFKPPVSKCSCKMKIHVRGTLNFWTKFHHECHNISNISNSCWHISIWFKAMDRLTLPSLEPYAASVGKKIWMAHTYFSYFDWNFFASKFGLQGLFSDTQPRCIFTVAAFGLKAVFFILNVRHSLSRCFQVTENMVFGDRLSITLYKKVKGGQGQRDSASLLHFKGSFMENETELLSVHLGWSFTVYLVL